MQDKLGDIFVDGKIVNLDSSSVEYLDKTIEEINFKQKMTLTNINNIFIENH